MAGPLWLAVDGSIWPSADLDRFQTFALARPSDIGALRAGVKLHSFFPAPPGGVAVGSAGDRHQTLQSERQWSLSPLNLYLSKMLLVPMRVVCGYKHPRMTYGEDVDFVIDNFIDYAIGVADNLPKPLDVRRNRAKTFWRYSRTEKRE